MSKVTPNFLEGMVDSTLKNNTLERKNKRKKNEKFNKNLKYIKAIKKANHAPT